MTNQLSKQLSIIFLSAASSKKCLEMPLNIFFTGWVHVFDLHRLNRPGTETIKLQSQDFLYGLRFLDWRELRTRYWVSHEHSDRVFWSKFKMSFAPAKMQPHLNEVIQKCSLQNKRHTAFSSGRSRGRDSVRTQHNLSADRDLCLIGLTRKQFTLIDSLMND